MQYDVIIIGSGIAGLSAGAKLSKEGKRVLIIEQHYHVGTAEHEEAVFIALIKIGAFNGCHVDRADLGHADGQTSNQTDRAILNDQPSLLEKFITIINIVWRFKFTFIVDGDLKENATGDGAAFKHGPAHGRMESVVIVRP